MNTSLKHHWVAILVATLVTFLTSVALTVVQPMEYRASFTVLAIDQDTNLDGYAAAKSAERLSQSLGRNIATAAFADQVYQQLKDRVDLKDNPLVSADAQTRRDEWKKRVVAQSFPDVGQVKVSVFQKNRTQADTVANALSMAVTAYGTEYLGGGKNVLLKIVDTPLTSKSPVRPNVFANLAVGLILGFGGSIAFFLLFGPQTTNMSPMLYAPMMPSMLSMSQAQPAAPTHVAHEFSSTSPTRRRSEPAPAVAAQAAEPVLHIPSMPAVTPEQPKAPVHASPSNLPVIDEWVMP